MFSLVLDKRINEGKAISHPIIFSKEAFSGRSSTSRISRAKTPLMKGDIFRIESASPAAAIRTLRSEAIGAEPKTGAFFNYFVFEMATKGANSIPETRDAFCLFNLAETSLLVSG